MTPRDSIVTCIELFVIGCFFTLDAVHGNYGPFPERWWRVLDSVREVAAEVDATPAQVALRWAGMVEGLTSIPIVGGHTLEQLEENVIAFDILLTPKQHHRIADAGKAAGVDSPYFWV
jgi:aryl-alcohol dehydrogenase-like predicted oxidoreductase